MARRPLSVLAIGLLRATIWLIRLLPHGAAYKLGQAMGLLYFAFARNHRRLALANLGIAYGDEKSLAEKKRIVLGSFMNMGLNMMDFCRIPSLFRKGFPNSIKVEGIDSIERALSEGRGAILLTGHVGSWELMAAAAAYLGVPLAAIVASTRDPLIDRFMKDLRESYGYETLMKRKEGSDVMSRLRRNVAVGILADESPRSDGVLIEFFGQDAGATRGPAVFALRSGAPVIPAFIIRVAKPAGHRLIIERPLELIRTGDTRTDVVRNTELFQGVIERYVREYPEQWLWMQKRWKIRGSVKRRPQPLQQEEHETGAERSRT